ncbi:MAG: penicillin-binding transpeptidase domain-containing protein [Candidatus Limnocylindria bacterium]
MTSTRVTSRIARLLLVATLLAACVPSTIEPSPSPSASAALSDSAAKAAALVARTFVAAWRGQRYARLTELLTPADRERYSPAAIIALLRQFDELAGVTTITGSAGLATPGSTAGPSPSEAPVPAFEVPINLTFETNRFGPVRISRTLVLTQGSAGWEVRWSPSLLFPELGDRDTLALLHKFAPRGRILDADGAVFAETRGDGKRVYPQEWLAGQTIGYVAPVTAEELPTLRPTADYQVGEMMGRSGLEQGAEDLLRGVPGAVLVAKRPYGDPVRILERPTVPGADVTITIRRDLQATAEASLAPYANAATAVIDPNRGEVWVLASAPLFNPNSMTLGTTFAGQPLPKPSASARLNKAALAAHPAGSSFKPFTLLAALKSGVASPATRMSCNGTWTYSGFTFHNYKDHHLGPSVSLVEAMAFSCNTTYMPLSIRVWQADKTALTDVVAQFGFGQSTGMAHLADAPGVLPDARYFETHKRWDGRFVPYGGFDQIQLAIGQGSYLGTPLQLANAYAAFGNGGTLWWPRIVLKATLPDGRVVERNLPRAIRKIDIAPEHLAYLAQTLRAVITLSYGTAHRAFSGFPIAVAGKSGTAETGGPLPDAWFPAYAPIGGAKIAVATVLVEISRNATGGSDAAPLVRRVMSKYFFP